MPQKIWRALFLGPVIFFLQAGQAQEPVWEKLEGCKYAEGPHDDGDSMEVDYGEKRYVFRLFFVDCVEKSPHSRAHRVEQAKYFGLTGGQQEDTALEVAYEAAKFTKDQLTKPFTVYTRWQKVDPTGENPAIRAFVETSTGADLGSLLVSNGLAIIREGKVASDHPNGKNTSELVSALREAETKARLDGKGAWGLAKPAGTAMARPPVTGGGFAATDRDGLFASAGHPVKVHGRVVKIGVLPDGRITFLDFEGNKSGDFVGVVRSGFLPAFHEQFPDGLETGLLGKEVTLEGVVTLYRNIPQIELQHPRQIQILPPPAP